MTSGLSVRRHLTMRATYILAMTLVFLSVLNSCGSGKNLQMAERGVDQFHAELDSEKFDVIYSAADEDLQKATPATDFANLLGGIHRKLGLVQHSQLANFQSGWFTGQGTVVTLVYDTRFVGGAASEQFVWHIRDNRPLLSGYHVTSNALVEK